MKDVAGCCSSGEAAPDGYKSKGLFARLGPLDVYISEPGQDGRLDRVLLLLPDGFGLATHNIILADHYAEAGYRTILVDYFQGDALPTRTLQVRATPEEIVGWLARHPHDRIEVLLDGLVASLRSAEPDIEIIAVGYCFGGKHALLMAKKHLKAAALFHPSFVVEDDIRNIKAPLYIGLAEEDDMVPETLARDLESWTRQEEVQATVGLYPGVGHGFAARPATQDPFIREQYDRAFDTAMTFFQKS